ncbi:MAG: mechanosensitive ion channel family protein [Planctomycetota bacterium]|jgi:small conductance mechanosensitive channel
MRAMVIRWSLFLFLFAPAALAQQAEQTAAEAAKLRVEAADRALDGAKAELDKAPTDEAAKTKVADARTALSDALDDLEKKAKALDNAGGDAAPYNEVLIGHGRVVLDAAATLNFAKRWANKGKDWVMEDAPGVAANFLGKLALFLIIFYAFKFIARAASRVTERALASSKLRISDLLKTFCVNIIRKTLVFIGLIMALEAAGIPMGPVLAGVGVLGFVVAFALQNTLGNFASGIMILLYRPYDVGDVIDSAGTKGKVDAMSLVSTTLITPDNQVVIVPNNTIWGSTITNVTARDTRRVDLTFGVGYGDDLDKAEQMITAVVTAHEKVLKDPAPTIRIANLGDSSVDFVVRPWCKTADYWDVFFDLQKQLKQRADTDGIEIPFPQRDVHIHETKAAS